jgi:hypothetical protein
MSRTLLYSPLRTGMGTVNLLRVNMIIWQEDADLPRL